VTFGSEQAVPATTMHIIRAVALWDHNRTVPATVSPGLYSIGNSW
jgi:hypothetical protein